ncbi:hypothetical protein L2E82_04452 [Cichorium intybus]|uniref:Uncharacterized protein n=1 Tax=Cichorium intybus TaxID=13427 RepID=A0ACB9H539_CICIN|nr:hypothetical protein L2E82_04452 [Cichorium intybus]
MVENVVEEEVVGDNVASDSIALDVFDVFENVDLVMSESIPSPEILIKEDVVEGAVSDSADPSPTTPKIVDNIGEGGVDDNNTPEPIIFENFEYFESKDLLMGDFIPPPDQTSRSLLVPIHLLDDDQEDDVDKLVFENNKHDFIATHDPFMNGKLDVINTIDEDIWKHPDKLPSDPIRLENFYWYCKPKLQTEDDTQYVSNKRGTIQLLEAALGSLHVKPMVLKKYRRKDRAWRFRATSKYSREIIIRQQLGSNRRTDKPFDPGKFEEQWVNKGTMVLLVQGKCGVVLNKVEFLMTVLRDRKPTRCAGVDLGARAPRFAHIRAAGIDRSESFDIKMSFRLDHQFLQFPAELDSAVEYISRRDALIGRRVLEATIIDRDILRDAGLLGDIEPFLHRTWVDGEARECNLRDFGRRTGTYTEADLQHRHFTQFLTTCIQGQPESAANMEVWTPLSNVFYEAGTSRETIFAIHFTDSCTASSPPPSCIGKGARRFLHLPFALAVSLSTRATGASTSSPLGRGYVITRLARSYRILTAPVVASLTALPPVRTTARALEKIGLIEQQRPGQFDRVARMEDQLEWIGEVLLELATQQGQRPRPFPARAHDHEAGSSRPPGGD